MKRKNKWGKHKKKYIRKYCGFPELCLLSYDGLGDYSRVTEEGENGIFDCLKKYKFYDIANGDTQV